MCHQAKEFFSLTLYCFGLVFCCCCCFFLLNYRMRHLLYLSLLLKTCVPYCLFSCCTTGGGAGMSKMTALRMFFRLSSLSKAAFPLLCGFWLLQLSSAHILLATKGSGGGQTQSADGEVCTGGCVCRVPPSVFNKAFWCKFIDLTDVTPDLHNGKQ